MDALDAAGDNASPISRLSKAKSVIENYMISHPENRYGLVIFAGKSRLVSPLTTEHASLLSFLASIDSKSIREGGTDFHEALTLSLDRFETKEMTPHAIVLLSDGGDKDDSPDMDSIKSLFQGKHSNLTTIGLGRMHPSPIPIGTNPFGEAIYKKFNGEVVLSGLNKAALEDLAKIGAGSYISQDSAAKDLKKSLSTIARQAFARSSDSQADATVRILFAMSFFFFLMFLLIPSSFLKRCNDL